MGFCFTQIKIKFPHASHAVQVSTQQSDNRCISGIYDYNVWPDISDKEILFCFSIIYCALGVKRFMCIEDDRMHLA